MTPLYWLAIFLVIYCYFGYPIVIAILARIFGHRVKRSEISPSVSIVISVWNEETVIESKIRNLLALDYPKEKVEILIGSDASTDQTVAVIRRFNDPRVRLVDYPTRRGKPAVINDLLLQARNDVVIFNDARQALAPEAVRELVKNFADSRVGCVSGELVFENPQGETGKGVDLYWRYEKFIRQQESRLHSMMGATGAIYAIRRELFSPIPPAMILDDMYVPFRIIEQGFRAILDNQAKAFDRAAEDPTEEYRRKVRTICGNYQIFSVLPQMFIPLKSPIAVQLFSHKLLRVIVPFLLVFIFLATWNFVDVLIYRWLGTLQVVFYGMAGGAPLLRRVKITHLQMVSRLCYIPYTFCLLNWSAVAGFWRFVTSGQDVTWEKARG